MPDSCLCEQVVIADPISVQLLPEDSPNTELDLTDVFTSPEDIDLEYEVITDNPELVKPVIAEDKLILDLVPDENGVAEVTVAAISPETGAMMEDTFSVVVDPVDDPLEVFQPIEDIDFTAAATEISLDLLGDTVVVGLIKSVDVLS